MIKNRHSFPGFLEVIHLAECDSTNTYIKNNYEALKYHLPVLVTSALQTAGRGREKRTWVSPQGKGLYSSFGFNLSRAPNLNLLPLIAGFSVIEALHTLTGLDFQLKWPNDVLYENKKIAGILIENVITEAKIFCITGIGINLLHAPADFPVELQDKATSLKIISGAATPARDLNPLLASVFFHWLEKSESDTRGEIIRTANEYSRFFIDKPISFHQPPTQKIVGGIFKGINRDGGLILETDDGRSVIFYSGEIL